MPTIPIRGFQGLNRRAALEVADPRSLYVGRNVDLTLGRSLRARGAVRKVADVDPRSVGLYVAGGVLRCAIPGGHSLPSSIYGSVRVKYDHLGGGYTPFTTGTVAVTKDSPLVTLTGGTWPTDIENTLFYVPGAGVTATVAARLSNTQINLSAPWTAPSQSGASFSLHDRATPYPLNAMVRVTAVEQFGFSRESGGYPYLVVERWRDPANHAAGTSFEHHWVTVELSDTGYPPATLVRLPFSPGPALAKLNGRLWAPDDTGSEVRFCSVEFGARDWTTPGDAGFISVLDHALGDASINGLGFFNDNLAVIFSDSVQLWRTDQDPTKIAFVRALGGPGTDAVDSVVNVRGDLFYFTRGGFRSLFTQTLTAQIDEDDDIGAPVYEITRDLEPLLARAVWSQRRGAYLCAFGEQVFVYRLSPQAKVQAWTTWDLPGTPVDYLVEMNGALYFRSGNAIYTVDEDADDTVEWEAQFHFAQGKDAGSRRQWKFIEVIQQGAAAVDFAPDPTRPNHHFPTKPVQIVGSTTGVNRIHVGALCPMLAVRFSGRGPWQLDSFSLTYDQLPW